MTPSKSCSSSSFGMGEDSFSLESLNPGKGEDSFSMLPFLDIGLCRGEFEA